MRARYDKSLVKPAHEPQVSLFSFSQGGYRWKNLSSAASCRLNPICSDFNFGKQDGKIPKDAQQRLIVLKKLNNNNRQSLI